jgi:hypothetical protein
MSQKVEKEERDRKKKVQAEQNTRHKQNDRKEEV